MDSSEVLLESFFLILVPFFPRDACYHEFHQSPHPSFILLTTYGWMDSKILKKKNSKHLYKLYILCFMKQSVTILYHTTLWI